MFADECLCSKPKHNIQTLFQEFKRTHMDNWSEHKTKFTEEQLAVMTELLVSPNYYA